MTALIDLLNCISAAKMLHFFLYKKTITIYCLLFCGAKFIMFPDSQHNIGCNSWGCLDVWCWRNGLVYSFFIFGTRMYIEWRHLICSLSPSLSSQPKLNMESLTKPELLMLFSILEGELEARDLVIDALKVQRTLDMISCSKSVFFKWRFPLEFLKLTIHIHVVTTQMDSGLWTRMFFSSGLGVNILNDIFPPWHYWSSHKFKPAWLQFTMNHTIIIF